MAIAPGQSASAASTTATSITTAAVTTAATGSSFLIGASIIGVTPAVSDSKSNTYTLIGSTFSKGGQVCGLYLCTNGAGGSGHTAIVSGGALYNAVFFLEVTGGALASLVDQIPATQWNDDTSSPFTSNATSATTQAAEMCVAFTLTVSSSGTETLNWSANSYTQQTALGNANAITGGIATKVVSATGTQQTSFTSSGAGTTEAYVTLVTLEAAAASGAISGSTAITFGQSGALVGAGSLGGTTPITFGQSGALSGSGALGGTTAVTFSQSGSLAGAGALAATSAVNFGESGAIAAVGALAATTSIVFAVSGTLNQPSGALAGTTPITFAASATPAGAASLIGNAALLFTASGTLTQPYVPPVGSGQSVTLPPPPSAAAIAVTNLLTVTAQWLAWFQQLWTYACTIGANGPTAQRPTKGLFVGQNYFDTTLGYQVTVKFVGPPAVWVNGAGSVV
jgi:hypothetical protein